MAEEDLFEMLLIDKRCGCCGMQMAEYDFGWDFIFCPKCEREAFKFLLLNTGYIKMILLIVDRSEENK